MAAPMVPGSQMDAIRQAVLGRAHAPATTGVQEAGAEASEDSSPRNVSLTDFHAVLVMAPGVNRDALAMGLWDSGMLVTTFKSPHEAEGVLVGEAVHVVLLDAALGAFMAPQIVWWLNAVGRGAVRVVVFGEVSDEERTNLLRQGVAYVVPRPMNAALFGRQLGEAMGFAPNRWR